GDGLGENGHAGIEGDAVVHVGDLAQVAAVGDPLRDHLIDAGRVQAGAGELQVEEQVRTAALHACDVGLFEKPERIRRGALARGLGVQVGAPLFDGQLVGHPKASPLLRPLLFRSAAFTLWNRRTFTPRLTASVRRNTASPHCPPRPRGPRILGPSVLPMPVSSTSPTWSAGGSYPNERP